jgi:hypothetical protein
MREGGRGGERLSAGNSVGFVGTISYNWKIGLISVQTESNCLKAKLYSDKSEPLTFEKHRQTKSGRVRESVRRI